MTQDKVVYTVAVDSRTAVQSVQDLSEDVAYIEDFSSEVINEESNDNGITLTLEVHGDAYGIPIFEESLESLEGVSVVDADVAPGESKFA